MSAEDATPDAPTAAAAPAPLQAIELKLSDILKPAARMAAPERYAGALAMLRLIDEVRDTHRERVNEILAGAWNVAFKIVCIGMREPGWEIQVQLLQEWFAHRGDWGAMRRCMTDHGERAQSRPGELLELIDKHFDAARKEYSEVYGEKPA